MSYTLSPEPGDVSPAKVYARCIRCTSPIHLDDVLGQHQPLPGNGRRFVSGVVKLGVGEVYYCKDCGPDLRFCRECGCTNEVACLGGCFWVTDDLCSTCHAAAPKAAGVVCPACGSKEIAPRWMWVSREYYCRGCHEVFTVEVAG